MLSGDICHVWACTIINLKRFLYVLSYFKAPFLVLRGHILSDQCWGNDCCPFTQTGTTSSCFTTAHRCVITYLYGHGDVLLADIVVMLVSVQHDDSVGQGEASIVAHERKAVDFLQTQSMDQISHNRGCCASMAHYNYSPCSDLQIHLSADTTLTPHSGKPIYSVTA